MRKEGDSQVQNTRVQKWKSDDPNDDCSMPEDSFYDSDRPGDAESSGADEQFSLELIPLEQVCSPLLKAYFAESMTGTFENLFVSDIAIRVREAVASLIAANFTSYAPANHTPCGGGFSNAQIYETNFKKISDSDLVIFHRNAPSSGMGMEAEIAAGVMVPAVILIPKGTPCSLMFPGFDLLVIATIEYSDVNDLSRQLRAALNEVVNRARKWRTQRRENLRNLQKAKIGPELQSARILRGITREAMVEFTGMPGEFLRRIELSIGGIETLTTSQLSQLCKAYGVTVALTGDAPLSVYRKELNELPQPVQASLINLARFIQDRELADGGNAPAGRIHDWKILKLWKHYKESYDYGLVGREALDEVRTASDWESLYDSTLM